MEHGPNLGVSSAKVRLCYLILGVTLCLGHLPTVSLSMVTPGYTTEVRALHDGSLNRYVLPLLL